MILSTATTADELSGELYPNASQTTASAVSWGAIIAGAAAAAALSLILLMLGTGLGLSSVSPWAYSGVSATTFGVTTILWLTFTQLAASGMAGYLAGRLRTRWVGVHADEVYFRDTAHGFLAWAVAAIVTAALLTSAIGSIVSGGVRAGTAIAGSVVESEMAKSNGDNQPLDYFIDALFRKDSSTVVVISTPTTAPEVTRIFMNTIHNNALPAEDVRYVGQLVAQRTGLTQKDAEKRVIDTYSRAQTRLRDAEVAAKDMADQGRKASAYAALWLFISLLIGAFIASFAALFGGRQRDL